MSAGGGITPHAFRARVTGFTLLELLVVLMLVSLVAGMVVPSVVGSIRQAQWRDLERRITIALSELPDLAFSGGKPLEVDAKSLQARLPQLPDDWQLELPKPLSYASNGMAKGGALVLRRPDLPDLRWRVEVLTGEPIIVR